jgi:long-chain fatty acid transport protein
MKTMNKLWVWPGVVGVVTYGAAAHANVELPSAIDARNTGMGSTGVATSDNGAASYHNPAGLSQIEKGAFTATFAPTFVTLEAPVAVPNQSEQSDTKFIPTFLLGGGYRINDRLVAGFAIFPRPGVTATYDDPAVLRGQKVELNARLIEAAPGLSYSITDAVSLGLTYRVTYRMQSLTQPLPTADPAPPPSSIHLELSGMDFLGVQLGALVRAAAQTRIGLTYRNKVSVPVDGTFQLGDSELDAASELASPHTFKVGLAQGLLDEKLTLALDAQYMLYEESNEEQVITLTLPDGSENEVTRTLDWQNTLGLHMGAEYRLAPDGLALRAGYTLAQSATSEEYPAAFLPPPTAMHAFHAGAGITVSSLDLDLGGYWARASTSVAAPTGALPGEYALGVAVVSASVTYRL